jgi:hypothetical protein
MTDNKKQRGAQDRSRVSAIEDYEIKYLAQKTRRNAEDGQLARKGRGRTETQ